MSTSKVKCDFVCTDAKVGLHSFLGDTVMKLYRRVQAFRELLYINISILIMLVFLSQK